MFCVNFKQNTYCPSNAIGGVTCHLSISVTFVISITQRCTSGLMLPGVGYRTLRVSGNELPPLTPLVAITEPVANHGYVIMPTLVSLNEAYTMWVPSSELQIASGAANISSVKANKHRFNYFFSGSLFIFSCDTGFCVKLYINRFCSIVNEPETWYNIIRVAR